ncbi:MAG: transcription elongation factor GreA [Thermomicrobiales bacterium]|jgi:transcription elongation factor GreA|nr:transcription elongation factor GreA [Thermomicrobiales bacterium]MEA2523640.1 transcription elongation factor GreA [Thermomicrobiales bacterium]
MVKDRIVRLTSEGKTKLEEELAHLLTVKKPELATRIQEATEHGDISDNSEYEELKEDFVLTEARIHELEHVLERAEIVVPPTTGSVGLGSVVTIRSDDGEEETWRLVGPEEADTREGTISTDSPVGSALMGCRVGDAATVATPAGALVFSVLRVA